MAAGIGNPFRALACGVKRSRRDVIVAREAYGARVTPEPLLPAAECGSFPWFSPPLTLAQRKPRQDIATTKGFVWEQNSPARTPDIVNDSLRSSVPGGAVSWVNRILPRAKGGKDKSAEAPRPASIMTAAVPVDTAGQKKTLEIGRAHV